MRNAKFAPQLRDTSPHGRDALTRAFAWILDWGVKV